MVARNCRRITSRLATAIGYSRRRPVDRIRSESVPKRIRIDRRANAELLRIPHCLRSHFAMLARRSTALEPGPHNVSPNSTTLYSRWLPSTFELGDQGFFELMLSEN